MISYIKHIPILALAASITYFSYTISNLIIEIDKTRQAIPELVNQASTLEESIKVSQWLNVVSDINQKIPSIVEQFSQINQQIPSIVNQIDQLQNNTVPSLLDEVKIVRKDVIPPILEQVSYTNEQTVPKILAESSEIRQLTPVVLTRVENIAEHTEQVISNTTAGAVKGTVKGVIKTPFTIIGDFSDRVISTNEQPAQE